MDPEQEAFYQCQAILSCSLDTSAIHPVLIQNGLYTARELRPFRSSGSSQIQFLLNTLPGKKDWWNKFIKCLKETDNGSGHGRIVSELEDAKKDIETKRKEASIFNERVKLQPSKSKLLNFVLPRVVKHWYEVGIMLLDEEQENQIDLIQQDGRGDPKKCCVRMFRYWLDTHRDANWQDIIDALLSPGIDLPAVANEIKDMLSGKLD